MNQPKRSAMSRPFSATLTRKGDGSAPLTQKIRPTSAVVRSHKAAKAATGDPAVDDMRANIKRVHHLPTPATPLPSSSSPLNPRTSSTKPSRTAIQQSIEESKQLIGQIFGVCEVLHMEPSFVDALHRSFQQLPLTCPDSFDRLLSSLQEHKRASLCTLRKVEARERVLTCMDQFVEGSFLAGVPPALLEAAASGTISSTPSAAASRRYSELSGEKLFTSSSVVGGRASPAFDAYLSPVALAMHHLLEVHGDYFEERLIAMGDHLPPLAAEGDAIIQSLRQCTEQVQQSLLEWDHTYESLWTVVESIGKPSTTTPTTPSPGGVSPASSAAMANTDQPTKLRQSGTLLPRVGSMFVESLTTTSVAPPPDAHRRAVFLYKGEDYRDKMKRDAVVYQQLRDRWGLSQQSKALEAKERRMRKARETDAEIRAREAEAARRTREEFLNVAATKIQAMYRCHRAVMWFQMHFMKRKAVSTISNWWRRITTRRRFVMATDFNTTAIVLQRLWRGFRARKRLPALLRRNRAARSIQRWWRYWDCHFRMILRKVQRLERCQAALTIKKAMKVFLVRSRASRHTTLRRAVLLLQRWGRGRMLLEAELSSIIEFERIRKESQSYATGSSLVVVVPHHLELVQAGGVPVADETCSGSLLNVDGASPIPKSSPELNDTVPTTENSTALLPSKKGERTIITAGEPCDATTVHLARHKSDEPLAKAMPTEKRAAPLPDVQESLASRLYPSKALTEHSVSRTCFLGSTAPRRPPSVDPTETSVTTSSSRLSRASAASMYAAAIRIQCFWRVCMAQRALSCRRHALAKQVALERIRLQRERLSVDLQSRLRQRGSQQLCALLRSRRAKPQEAAALRIQRAWRHRMMSRRSMRSVNQKNHSLVVLCREDVELESFLQGQKLRMKSNDVPTKGTTSSAKPGTRTIDLHTSGTNTLDTSIVLGETSHTTAKSRQRKQKSPQRSPTRSNTLPLRGASFDPPATAHARSAGNISVTFVKAFGELQAAPATAPTAISPPIPAPSNIFDAEMLRTRKQAALRLSSFFKKIYTSWKGRIKRQTHAVSVIARAFRHFKLQRSYFIRKKLAKDEAARQALLAQHIAEEKAFFERRSAALVITHWYQRIRCERLLCKLNQRSAEVLSRPDRDRSAATIQAFWRLSKARLQMLRLRCEEEAAALASRRSVAIRAASVRIQTAFRRYLHRDEIQRRRAEYRANQAAAAIVIQREVRKWLAKNTLWVEKRQKLSMFKELIRLRQQERTRATAAPLRPPPKSAW